ncbi:MAG: hypothetical protein DMF69_10360 [Acidobacteria bacterium]|nr:MAG: hypothetical protein DMF69_10360 [Acidobacteriota bacterium]
MTMPTHKMPLLLDISGLAFLDLHHIKSFQTHVKSDCFNFVQDSRHFSNAVTNTVTKACRDQNN